MYIDVAIELDPDNTLYYELRKFIWSDMNPACLYSRDTSRSSAVTISLRNDYNQEMHESDEVSTISSSRTYQTIHEEDVDNLGVVCGGEEADL
ncbi:MAG: hypothetical protein SFT91_04675 [Rickettsiaceae bacterium]|nr:hypothetical protein [Rickettsiaceae bacterium]